MEASPSCERARVSEANAQRASVDEAVEDGDFFNAGEFLVEAPGADGPFAVVHAKGVKRGCVGSRTLTSFARLSIRVHRSGGTAWSHDAISVVGGLAGGKKRCKSTPPLRVSASWQFRQGFAKMD